MFIRTRAFAFASLTFVATGCSVFGGDDDTPPAPPLETAEPPPVSGSPTESDLTEKQGVFAAAGKKDGDGSRGAPFGTLAQAIEVAKLSRKRVFACAGTYEEQITIENGVSLTGGLDCSHPSWSIGTGRSTLRSPASPAMRADKVAIATRLERFDVFAPDGNQAEPSSIGLLATDVTALTVADASITTGNGRDGSDGAPGIQLVQTGSPNGNSGVAPTSFFGGLSGSMPPDMPGGTSVCTGEAGHDGERGGYGGSSGVYEAYFSGVTLTMRWRIVPGYEPRFGEVRGGAAGADGQNGASNLSDGRANFRRTGFVRADGSIGTAGAPGQGGTGGRGHFPNMQAFAPENRPYALGATAGSGGAGGCPGLAGTAGEGGGASVGALLFSSPVAFQHVAMKTGRGGAGGKGNFGSEPTAGGLAGIGVRDGFIDDNGAPGGHGGRAGTSGSGAGGPSLAIAHSGDKPLATEVTFATAGGGSAVAELSSGGRTIAASSAGASGEIVELFLTP